MATVDLLGRRRALLIAALPIHRAWGVEVPKLGLDNQPMLVALGQELGLFQPGMLELAQRIRSGIDPIGVEAPLREAAQRMRASIGLALHTAKATMPALIEDDFRAGRTVQVHGVVFSACELALLLAASDLGIPFSG